MADEQQPAEQQAPADEPQFPEWITSAIGNAERLRQYWSHGEGAARIRWGQPGDFMRCVRQINKYMTTEQAKGYCNERHQDALGVPPGGED